MRKLFIIGSLIVLLALYSSVAMACNCGKKSNAGSQSSTCQHQCSTGCGQSASSENNIFLAQGKKEQERKEAELKAVEVDNKICPVSGNKVGEMGEGVKYEYKGRIYNLCCSACIKDFKKNPKKYSKIAEKEVAGKKLQEVPDTHNIHNHNNS